MSQKRRFSSKKAPKRAFFMEQVTGVELAGISLGTDKFYKNNVFFDYFDLFFDYLNQFWIFYVYCTPKTDKFFKLKIVKGVFWVYFLGLYFYSFFFPLKFQLRIFIKSRGFNLLKIIFYFFVSISIFVPAIVRYQFFSFSVLSTFRSRKWTL